MLIHNNALRQHQHTKCPGAIHHMPSLPWGYTAITEATISHEKSRSYTPSPGFLIRFLAWTKLARIKLYGWANVILTAPATFKTGNIITLLVPTSSTALQILAHVMLLLRQSGPNLIITLGHRAPSCAIWCAIGPYQKPWPSHNKPWGYIITWQAKPLRLGQAKSNVVIVEYDGIERSLWYCQSILRQFLVFDKEDTVYVYLMYIHIFTHRHKSTRTHAHTHTCIHTHTRIHTHAHTHTHTRIHTYTHARTHTHICTYTHTNTHTHMHTHTMHTHARIHTRTHTHIHTHITHTTLLCCQG